MPYGDADALEAGDIVWVDFGLPMGHEQAGRRPAIVVSPRQYNESSSLIVVCPITRNTGAWAFKVKIENLKGIAGAILVDQVRSIDHRARFVRRMGRIDVETLDQVYGKLASLLGIPVSN